MIFQWQNVIYILFYNYLSVLTALNFNPKSYCVIFFIDQTVFSSMIFFSFCRTIAIILCNILFEFGYPAIINSRFSWNYWVVNWTFHKEFLSQLTLTLTLTKRSNDQCPAALAKRGTQIGELVSLIGEKSDWVTYY